MVKVGVTGGIGVGKTIVCRMFQLLGAPVYDSDGRAKWLMSHDKALRQDLVQAFGPESYMSSGELNRTYLAGVVFNNPERLAKLNALVHPHVGRDFSNWCTLHAQAPYVIKEAALMFESEAWKQMDKIVTVTAPVAIRLKRLKHRDPHRSEADILAIIDKQMSDDEKIARADFVIHNDDKQLLIPQVLQLHNHFITEGTPAGL